MEKILPEGSNDSLYFKFLQNRANRCCCKYCGSDLELRRLVYSNCDIARLELCCTSCGRIEFGTEKEIYKKAVTFYQESGWDYYPDLNAGEQKTHMNVAKICELTDWMMQEFGLLTENHFSVVLTSDTNDEGNGFTEECENIL